MRCSLAALIVALAYAVAAQGHGLLIPEEKSIPLAYARRRLAVFELGLQAMVVCSDFEREERNSLFEKLYGERAIWDERMWELLRESGDYTHHPIGFFNQKM